MERSAAWVQAVGTILAFVAAIILSTRDHRRAIRLFEDEKRREDGVRQLRAHSLAHALFPDLLELKAMIGASESVIFRRRAQNGYLNPPHELTQDWIIDIPNGFQSANESFYLLGTKTAPIVSQLLSLLYQHNRVAGKLSEELSDRRTFARAWSTFTNEELFANRFQLMKQNVDEALDLVGKIRDMDLLPDYYFVGKNE